MLYVKLTMVLESFLYRKESPEKGMIKGQRGKIMEELHAGCFEDLLCLSIHSTSIRQGAAVS